jgi:hypothetical protein
MSHQPSFPESVGRPTIIHHDGRRGTAENGTGEETETDHGTEQELERCIEDLLAQKKSDIERALAEAIDQEKEKARQRTLELEQEFERGREALTRHQSMMADVNAATGNVRERIGKHVEQAGHCRIMVRRLADKIGESLERGRAQA